MDVVNELHRELQTVAMIVSVIAGGLVFMAVYFSIKLYSLRREIDKLKGPSSKEGSKWSF